MKATGIVRRIDDLGRVVIPKEIRRTMRIREGDPLEIYTSSNGEVVFKKYSPIGELNDCAGQYADVLYKTCVAPALICDRDHVIAAAGISKKEVLERRVTPALEEAMEARRCVTSTAGGARLRPVEGLERQSLVCCPVIAGGDITGCVLLLSMAPEELPSEVQIKLTQAAAGFLSRQLEE